MKNLIILLAVCTIVSCTSKNSSTDSGPTAFEISNIDTSMDPCTNFYKYAIGNWQKNNPVPETESRWMSFNILAEQNREKLMAIVEEVASNTKAKKGSEEQLIRDLYNSGMDTVAIEKAGISGIQSILTEIDEAQRWEDIVHLFGELSPIGVSNPIGLYIGADRKDSEKNQVYAGQSGLNLPDIDYYLQDNEKFKDIRAKYVLHIDRMMELANQPTNVGERVLAVEKQLAAISWTRLQRRDPVASYNKMALETWNSEIPNLDIKTIFSTRGFGKFDTLVVGQPSYFESLNNLAESISVDDWKLYLKWNAITGYANFLNKALVQENFNFYSTTLRGTAKMKPRNERVYRFVDGMLGEPLGKLFVKEYFTEESKVYMTEMIENLRSAYRDRINSLTWMSDETKAKALKKLEAFTYKVGYPDEWEDYSTLEIGNNLVENAMNVRKFGYQKMLEKLNKPVDKKEWHMNPQTVNAYYNPSNNEIVFPAGILQPPFFHKDFDHAINYGGIGAVIGHEFSHGFDDQGSKYDWNGNLNEWWSKEDRAKFESLASKLGQQYDSYSPVEGMNVNGKLTMGENIADLGGITLAYAALEKKYKGKTPEPIDGFEWNQRFFLGWANVWKGNIKEEEVISRLKSDNHSPGEYRVIGPLVNFEPFYEAFGTCKSGAMHKPDSARVVIW